MSGSQACPPASQSMRDSAVDHIQVGGLRAGAGGTVGLRRVAGRAAPGRAGAEAEQAGAFVEDALSEQDAAESDIDLVDATAPAAMITAAMRR